jgi:methylamine---glutamate N-methyltransferase subunit B
MPPEAPATNVHTLDLAAMSLREVNSELQSRNGTGARYHYRVATPHGAHALACGLDAPLEVEIAGNTGYYCAGMNKEAHVEVMGTVGPGVAENMMSGRVHVHGNASQSAGATAHGGLLVIEGDAGARCGISLKGADIVVKGSVGHMSMFMAQAGRLVVLGDASDALGDSLYEARIYVRGSVKSLGADCIEKEMRPEHAAELEELLARAGCRGVSPGEFRRYGSARQLYNFKIENLDAY